MHLLPAALLSLLPLLLVIPHTSSTPIEPAPKQESLFSDSPSIPPISSSSLNVPTRYISTLLARRLLSLSTTADLATIFPSDLSSSHILPNPYSRTPPSVASTPISLPEYIADCEGNGNPTIIALDVSTSTKNALHGSNVSLSVSWWDEYQRLTGREAWAKADLPRLAAVGYLEEISKEEVDREGVVECFQRVHGDSKWWTPGRKGAAHGGKWMRVRVEEVYWIGGFGDRNYIGWLDGGEWRGVSKKEIERVRLPGESLEGEKLIGG